MAIYPTVVIGLGSSGAYVVSNLERILYEVVGEEPLDLFRLISLDTDSRTKDDEPPPGGRRVLNRPIRGGNTGQKIADLTHKLGSDFNWCPPDLTLAGEGAGNLRSGGRLLLFSDFPAISEMIERSAFEVRDAANNEQTKNVLRKQFERRGMSTPDDLVDPSHTVVYVVGTLAGGTCSGMCIDLGYAIKNAAPGAERVGVFFAPVRTAAPVFLENTWAALKDLEFFCDTPSAFRATWLSKTGAKQRFEANSTTPFDFAYLLSANDEHGNLRMPYASTSSSPLVVMASMQLAASLLGMHTHIAAKHVDIAQHVQTKLKNRFFLNYSLRAVSYPKYEISEAAACMMISERLCARWLNQERYYSAAGAQGINEENVRAVGRKRWNDRFEGVWRGLGRDVQLRQLVDGVVKGTLEQPSSDLHYQFTHPVGETVFSLIAQVLASRRLELQKTVIDGLGAALEQTQNVRYGELYVDGVKSELEHTVRFWDAAGTPNRSDLDAWSSIARSQVEAALQRHSLVARILAARSELLSDELQNVITRLEMYLMRQVLGEVKSWIESYIVQWLVTLRKTLGTVRDLAGRRSATLVSQMQEQSGPILKLGRSRAETLKDEIVEIGSVEPTFPRSLLSSDDGRFVGLFAVKDRQEPQDDRQIFLTLKSDLQPGRLRALELKGSVNVLQQIREQERIDQVVNHFRDAQGMSLATKIGLEKSPDAVPSFIVAGTEDTARGLMRDMEQKMGNPPQAKPQALPIFDHMVIFYQEGACSVQPGTPYQSIPDVLTDAPTYRDHYSAKMGLRGDNLDPLSSVKSLTVGKATESEFAR